MLGAHTVEITYHLIAGDTRVSGDPWRVDFHAYSLYLLGAILIWQGVRLLRSAWLLARSQPGARGAAIRPLLVTLGVVLPLIAVHAFFGVLLSTIGSITLGVVLVPLPEETAPAAASAT